MTKKNDSKPNYADAQILENTRGDASYLPEKYKGYTDSFYEEESSSSVGSFLVGAMIGGVIGAATALFLAPKTGKEMREDFSSQAVHLKEKGIEISTVAKDKATEFSSVAKDKATEFSAVAKDKAAEFSDKATELTSVAKDKATEFSSAAKEKTDEVTKSIQEQSEQIVEKVKQMTSKTSVPMDDGTASSEGEEAIKFIEKAIADDSEEKTEDETAAVKKTNTKK